MNGEKKVVEVKPTEAPKSEIKIEKQEAKTNLTEIVKANSTEPAKVEKDTCSLKMDKKEDKKETKEEKKTETKDEKKEEEGGCSLAQKSDCKSKETPKVESKTNQTLA